MIDEREDFNSYSPDLPHEHLAMLSEVYDNAGMEENMNLTHEQKQAIDKGQAVPVVVDHIECVVIRRDIFETAAIVLDDLSDDEMQAIAARTLDDLDTAGPIG